MIAFLRKLSWQMQRGSREKDLAAELRFHLEEDAEDHRAAGMSAQEARGAARRELGNLGLVHEDARAMWSWTWLEQLLQDLRYGARNMLRNPAFTLLACLSLALGIGANTAIFSFMNAMLMRPLPVAVPASLVVLKWHIMAKKGTDDTVVHHASGYFDHDPKLGFVSAMFPYPAFETLRKPGGALSVVCAYYPAGKLNVFAGQQAAIMGGQYVSGDYFRGLGIVPAAGRLIAGYDDGAAAPPVVVLSYGFAQTRFGDAGAAVGQKVLIGNIPFTAIGVTPRGFFGVDPSQSADVYLPLHVVPLLDPWRSPEADVYHDEHYYWIGLMGRLRPGFTLAQAQAALAPAFEGWVAATATNDLEQKNLPRFLLQDGARGDDRRRGDYAQTLGILLAMVGLILAIACANIANLLLARSTARRREIAVRLSIGAGRWRVIRQLLTESLLLALLAGAAGLLVAAWGMRFLTHVLFAGGDSFAMPPQLNSAVLAAALLLTVVTGVLFGLAPALLAARVDPMPVLKESQTGGPRAGTRLRFGPGRMLVILQLALCLLLLVGANLFVRTLANLRSLAVGFERANLLLFKVNAQQAGHSDPEILQFYNDLKRRLATIPGVRSVTMANSPLIGEGAWGWPVVPLGREKPQQSPTGHGSGFSRSATRVLGVAPGFFSTMRIPLSAGREFNDRDRSRTPVAIVNEAWAKVNLDGGNPVGRSVVSYGLDKKPTQLEIVGLARNARYDDLTGDFPAIVYLPLEQSADLPVDEMTFFLRTTGDPLAYAGAVREIVHQADPRIPVADLSTQTAQIEGEMIPQTLFARLCTAFALLSLAIACVGLYGATSYTVARRTSEMGIRMALGARRETVVWMVLRDVLMLALVGMAIGLPSSMGASKLIQSLIFGVKPGDPWALAAALTILLAAALTAGYLPARRASMTDPMAALRHE